LFESGPVREALAQEAGLAGHELARMPWREHLQGVYDGMADLLEEHLNLESLWRYVED
jgi:adenosylcobyric acid synthase